MKKLAIFISGRGSNMKAIVEQCESGILQGIAKPVLVFANKENAAGIVYAKSKNIPTLIHPSKGKKRTEFDQQVIGLLKEHDFDYIILAGYMRVLSAGFVQHFEGKIINIHPADTQRHQGLGAYEWAYNQKLPFTMITIHYVDEGMDTGAIIAQHKVDLSGVDSLEEVEARGLKVEHEHYSKTLRKLFLSENNQ